MRKCLIYAEFPAPYRVAVFKELAKKYNIDVFYENRNTEERSKDYAVSSAPFNYCFLEDDKSLKLFYNRCRHLNEYDFVLDYNACIKNGVILAIAARIQKIPYFINNDGGFIRQNLIKDCIKRFVFKGASLCFAAGRYSKAYFKYYGVKNNRIRLHNFTSLEKGDVLNDTPTKQEKDLIRSKYGISKDKTVFVSVGQFIPRKGFDLLLKAWKEIDKSDSAELYIIGGGSGKQEYESIIEKDKLKNVIILEFLPKNELFKYYQAADVFVLATREDIWGLVINEAMSQGLPIISSDMCIAAKELIKPGENGYIYPVENVSRLCKYMSKLMLNPDVRTMMGKNNLLKIKDQTMQMIGRKHYCDIEQFYRRKYKINERIHQ